MIRGINLAGAEFGEHALPGVFGRDYTFNSEQSFRYFAAHGLRVFRIPLRWERLQPVPGGLLDPSYLGRLRLNAEWARAAGGAIIPELHNFGRYGGRVAPATWLADVWVRLSAEFRENPAVLAYDLMNEPHDLGGEDWKAISQQALIAIRESGDGKLVLVPGDSWSSANRWTHVHGPVSWIHDPAGNFAYEAHLYFDRNESGRYSESYLRELARNPNLPWIGRARLAGFAQWCAGNNVRGWIGEFGVPSDEPGWLAVLDDFLTALDELRMDGLYWAAGEWWPATDRLSVQPLDGFTRDRPQMAVLLRHLPSDSA